MKGQSIVLIGKEWNSTNVTSCDHVFRRLVRDGNTVLWVNSIATRRPNLASAHDWSKIARKVKQIGSGLRRVEENAWVFQPPVLPFPGSRIAQRINCHLVNSSILRAVRRLGMRSPQIWSFIPNPGYGIGALAETVSVYYCTDAWATIAGERLQALSEMEERLFSKVDVAFVTSHRLLNLHKAKHPNIRLALHGVDFDHFSKALSPEMQRPADVSSIHSPIAGFFGLIYHLIDLALLDKMARAHPEWSLVLIGEVRSDVSTLQALPNVHFLGHKNYAVLPEYCRTFSVGLMPYRADDAWIRHSNPLKLKEYLSAGVPPVSTDVPEVHYYEPFVKISRTDDEFIRFAESAIRGDRPELRRERSERMRAESWERKLDSVFETVMQTVEARTQRRARAATA